MNPTFSPNVFAVNSNRQFYETFLLIWNQKWQTEFSLSIEVFPLLKIFPLANQHEMKWNDFAKVQWQDDGRVIRGRADAAHKIIFAPAHCSSSRRTVWPFAAWNCCQHHAYLRCDDWSIRMRSALLHRVQTPELALVKVCACASSRCADLASSQQSRLLKWTRLFCFASRTYYADCWQQNNLTSTLEKYEIDTPWVSVYDCSVRGGHIIIREGRRQIIEDMIVLKTVVSLQMQPAYHFCSF